MADRVKYFVLGLLFLVVAGVIAYDSWNYSDTGQVQVADDDGNRVDVDHRGSPPVGGDLNVRPDDDTEAPSPDAGKDPARLPEPGPRPVEPRPIPPLDPAPEPRPLPDPEPEPRPEPESRDQVHIVQRGENLEAIALRYYKTRRGIAWIVERNSLQNPDQIYEKQKLLIPARKESGRKPVVVDAKARKGTAQKTIPERYVVKAGDGDLYAICRRFYGSKGEGARVARIMELNHLWSAKVKAGSTLVLPPK